MHMIKASPVITLLNGCLRLLKCMPTHLSYLFLLWGGQYDEAIRLLDKFRSTTSDIEGGGEDAEATTRNEQIGLRPNSWINDLTLAAYIPPMGEVRIEGGRRFDTAIQILHRMENDAKMSCDILPKQCCHLQNTIIDSARNSNR